MFYYFFKQNKFCPMKKLNFSDDPQAALAIVLSADMVRADEVFPETVGVSEPFEQLRNGKTSTRVIIQPKSRTLLDAELVKEICELLGIDKIADLDPDDAPAMLALCRVQGYNTSVSNAIAQADGTYANFRIADRNRSTLIAGTTDASQFGLAAEYFGMEVDKVAVCSIATVVPTALVANRNLNSRERNKVTNAVSNSKKLEFRLRNKTTAEIKAWLTGAGITVPDTATDMPALTALATANADTLLA